VYPIKPSMTTVEPGFRFLFLAFQAGTQGVSPASNLLSGLRGPISDEGQDLYFFYCVNAR